MRVQLVDPSAFTLPYDHSLCVALARAGAEVELVTSRFAYGAAPAPDGYALTEFFYRRARGAPGSKLRLATKLIEHLPDMLAYRRHAASAQVVHFQWLAVQPLDRRLLPGRPTALTAHDLLPREPRPFQVRAARGLYDAADAVIAHSAFGRRRLTEDLGVEAAKVRVIHHGAFDYLAQGPAGELPPELGEPHGRVVMFFGLLRPYKGVDVLLDAWRALGPTDAELWIVGRPRMALDPLLTSSDRDVKWVSRFVTEPELSACFRRADLVVLPYRDTDRFDFSGVLATALAFGVPALVSDVGGLGEVAEAGAAELVAPGDAGALAGALGRLLDDPARLEELARGARTAAAGPYSWAAAAEQTLELYRELAG